MGKYWSKGRKLQFYRMNRSIKYNMRTIVNDIVGDVEIC